MATSAPAVTVSARTPIAKKPVKKYVRKTSSKDYALKIAIKDIVNADRLSLKLGRSC